jgi:hypothetical protein
MKNHVIEIDPMGVRMEIVTEDAARNTPCGDSASWRLAIGDICRSELVTLL